MTGAPGDPLTRAGRARAASATAKPPVGAMDAGARSQALLAMPEARTATQAQREAEARERAAQELAAARLTARVTMLRHHGCTGKDCRRKAHKDDREWRDTALMALGLIPDPGTDWEAGPGYSAAVRKRKDITEGSGT